MMLLNFLTVANKLLTHTHHALCFHNPVFPGLMCYIIILYLSLLYGTILTCNTLLMHTICQCARFRNCADLQIARTVTPYIWICEYLLIRPAGERSIAISLSVCLCVCLSVRENIYRIAGPICMNFFTEIHGGRGSVFLWRRCDTLCTSGFMDDVTFSRNGRYGDA